MAKSKEVVVIPTDLPIGTLFKFAGSDTVYVVRKAKSSGEVNIGDVPFSIMSCNGCAFHGDEICPELWLYCGSRRQDKTDVIFKEVKPKAND